LGGASAAPTMIFLIAAAIIRAFRDDE